MSTAAAVKSAKRLRVMLRFAQRITGSPGFGAHVRVGNWTSEAWLNGLAFCALVAHVRPDLLDFDKVEFKSRRQRLTAATRAAQEHLHVDARLVDVAAWCRAKLVTKAMVLPYYTQLYRALKNTSLPTTGAAGKAAARAAQRKTAKLLMASSAETKTELTRMFQVLDHRHAGGIAFRDLLAFLQRQPVCVEARCHGTDVLKTGVLGDLMLDSQEDPQLEIDFPVFCQVVLHLSDLIARADRRHRATAGQDSGWTPRWHGPAYGGGGCGGGGGGVAAGTQDASAAAATAVAENSTTLKLPGLDGGGGGGGGGGRAESSSASLSPGRRSPSSSFAPVSGSAAAAASLFSLDDVDDTIEPGPFGWKFEKKKKKTQVIDLDAYAGAAFRTRQQQ